ncbi:GNAT family N-acetyltransferase [Candidatus Leptofilum sp.]|uniref:GNAT family N-acetyltransferase n=1 Tax=Candidatus Leptofilum sp. TaxID=3241576 RepID=UPI003B5C6024
MSDEAWRLKFEPLTAVHIAEILTWRYEPPYDIYNMGDGTADPVGLTEAIDYFTQPEYHFQAMVRRPEGDLAAFCSYGPDGQVGGGDYSLPALDIGMGVHPANTGRGLGSMFAGAAIAYAEQTFNTPRLRVTIAEFNLRAQKVWQRHGFVYAQRFVSHVGKRPFIIFIRK